MKALEKKEDFLMIKAVDSELSPTIKIIHVKCHLNRLLKQLVILKLLKGPNRRIKWFCELAYKYQKTLAFRVRLDCLPAPSGTSMTSEDPPMPNAEVATAESVAEPDEDTVNRESEADPSPETSIAPQPLDLYQALCLKGLPRRLHLPAPKMLCRPSALRWIKPRCTRSCYETLDRVITIRYSRC